MTHWLLGFAVFLAMSLNFGVSAQFSYVCEEDGTASVHVSDPFVTMEGIVRHAEGEISKIEGKVYGYPPFPSSSSYPTYVSYPSFPSYPSLPIYPSYPSMPPYPSWPSHPSHPSYPNSTSYPRAKSYPGWPSYPSMPSYPSWPSYSSHASYPVSPSYPSAAEGKKRSVSSVTENDSVITFSARFKNGIVQSFTAKEGSNSLSYTGGLDQLKKNQMLARIHDMIVRNYKGFQLAASCCYDDGVPQCWSSSESERSPSSAKKNPKRNVKSK